LAASLAGCVDRGDWKPAPRLEPQALGAQQTLAGARLDAAAWPADLWWHAYGDPQLDALVAEALAGSPSLEIAQARLRAAQAQAIARAPRVRRRRRWTPRRLASDIRSTGYSRRRSPAATQPTLVWRSTSVSTSTSGAAIAPCWPRHARGYRPGMPTARRHAWRSRSPWCVLTVQLDLWYALLDVANDNLKQQTAILELTQQRVSAGLENTARVKQSEGSVALTRAGVAAVQASIDLARNQLADLAAAGPDRGQTPAAPAARAAGRPRATLGAARGSARAPPGRGRGACAGGGRGSRGSRRRRRISTRT